MTNLYNLNAFVLGIQPGSAITMNLETMKWRTSNAGVVWFGFDDI